MRRALLIGLLSVVVPNLVWFVALQLAVYSEILLVTFWSAPFLGSFTSAFLSPRYKWLVGLAMLLPAIVIPLTINAVYQAVGVLVDFPGVKGALILAWNIGLSSLVLGTLGTILGVTFSRERK